MDSISYVTYIHLPQLREFILVSCEITTCRVIGTLRSSNAMSCGMRSDILRDSRNSSPFSSQSRVGFRRVPGCDSYRERPWKDHGTLQHFMSGEQQDIIARALELSSPSVTSWPWTSDIMSWDHVHQPLVSVGQYHHGDIRL